MFGVGGGGADCQSDGDGASPIGGWRLHGRGRVARDDLQGSHAGTTTCPCTRLLHSDVHTFEMMVMEQETGEDEHDGVREACTRSPKFSQRFVVVTGMRPATLSPLCYKNNKRSLANRHVLSRHSRTTCSRGQDMPTAVAPDKTRARAACARRLPHPALDWL